MGPQRRWVASLVVEIDLNDQFRAERMSASVGKRRPEEANRPPIISVKADISRLEFDAKPIAQADSLPRVVLMSWGSPWPVLSNRCPPLTKVEHWLGLVLQSQPALPSKSCFGCCCLPVC